MSKSWVSTLVLSLAIGFNVTIVNAQILDGGETKNTKPPTAMDYLKAVKAAEQKEKLSPADAAAATIVEKDANSDTTKKKPKVTYEQDSTTGAKTLKDLNPKLVDGQIKVNPPALPNTTDGSKRGNTAFIRVLEKDEKPNPKEDLRLIFIYYDQFKITRSFSGGLGCDVKFAVMTNLDERLTNLSVKLVWPGISTSVSFSNVNPSIENYFTYALFGDGCYTMDKVPNIVVNRCRVKGLTQQQCAAKIRWLSKSIKK